MNDLLDKILLIGQLTDEEKQNFKYSFYKLLVAKTLDAIARIDSVAFVKLNDSLHQAENNPDAIQQALQDISQNPEVKEKINHVVVEVLTELADTISASATNEQKQEIVSSLS